MEKSKKNKIICPTCKGNGFVRIPYRLAKEEVQLNVESVIRKEK